MRESKYDDAAFFEKYSRMPRSREGLAAAGEWHALREMLPDFTDKRVLDLGCGFGWHCRCAVERGAASVVGVDLSERMLEEARVRTDSSRIRYLRMPIEDIDFPDNSFDVVISSLAFHYVESFAGLCAKVNRCLVGGGSFVFSVEHPVFTAQGSPGLAVRRAGKAPALARGPVFFRRPQSVFLGETVESTRPSPPTSTDCCNGFELLELVEPQPDPHLLEACQDIMRDELRRPMMLLVSARKR